MSGVGDLRCRTHWWSCTWSRLCCAGGCWFGALCIFENLSQWNCEEVAGVVLMAGRRNDISQFPGGLGWLTWTSWWCIGDKGRWPFICWCHWLVLHQKQVVLFSWLWQRSKTLAQAETVIRVVAILSGASLGEVELMSRVQLVDDLEWMYSRFVSLWVGSALQHLSLPIGYRSPLWEEIGVPDKFAHSWMTRGSSVACTGSLHDVQSPCLKLNIDLEIGTSWVWHWGLKP